MQVLQHQENEVYLGDNGARQKLGEHSDGLPSRASVEVMHLTRDQPPCTQQSLRQASALTELTMGKLGRTPCVYNIIV